MARTIFDSTAGIWGGAGQSMPGWYGNQTSGSIIELVQQKEASDRRTAAEAELVIERPPIAPAQAAYLGSEAVVQVAEADLPPPEPADTRVLVDA